MALFKRFTTLIFRRRGKFVADDIHMTCQDLFSLEQIFKMSFAAGAIDPLRVSMTELMTKLGKS